MIPPAEYLAGPSASAGSGLVISGRGLLRGFSAAESSGTAAATKVIRDGSAAGPIIMTVTFQPNESVREWFSGEGIVFQSGLFLSNVAGGSDWILYVTPESMFEGQAFPSEWYEGTF